MKFVSNDYVDKVIKRLKNKKEFTQEDFTNLNKELNQCNIQGTKIKYGYLSKCIRDMKQDIRDNVYSSAENCMDFNIKNENDILVQIINHVILEVPRANDLDTLYGQSERNNSKLREYKREQADFSNKIDKLENIKSEFIGILSIFAAVIIGFFGGLNAIGSAFENIDNVSKYRIVFMVTILGLIMFNVIYMLLREVSKLAGKEHEKDTQQCNECKKNKEQHMVKCAMTKHSYAFFFNITLISGLASTYVLYLIDKYNIISATLNLWKHTNINVAFIPIVGGGLFIGFSLITFRFFIKPNIHKYNCNKTSKEKKDNKKVKQELNGSNAPA